MPQVNTSLNSLAPGITTNNPINLRPLPGGGHKQVPNPHYKGPNAYRMDAKGKLSLIKDAGKKAGPLTRITNSPLAKFAGKALDIGGRLYGGYELLRPGATTRERIVGGGSIIAPLTPLAVGAMDYVQGTLSSDRGKAFTQAMTAGQGNQALRHLFGNYQRVPGLTPDVINEKPDIGRLKDLIVKNAEILPNAEIKSEEVPEIPLADQLQQERDSEGLTPMQQWAKKYKDTLAPKVKEGQSGFKEIDAYFKAQDMSIDEPGGRITPVEMLQKMSGGQEVVIGPDGISDPTPIKQEIASTPRQKDTPDINNPVPASKEKADQYLQSFLPGTPTLTTSFNQSQGNLPVSDYLSTDKLVGADYMRFGEDLEVTKAVFNLNPELKADYDRGYSRDYNPYRFVD